MPLRMTKTSGNLKLGFLGKKLRDGLLISMLILEEEIMNSLRSLILWV